MRLPILLVLLVLGLLVAGPAAAGTSMFVGAAEDNARSLDPLRAKTKMDLAAAAGLGTIRMTSIWSPGQRTIAGDDLRTLRNAAMAAQFDGVRVMLSIYPRDQRTTPRTSRARGEFAEYATSIARLVPSIDDFIVGNEPNLNLFWMPQFGPGGTDRAARSYELLLAKTYDALKSVSRDINVIGGALSPRGQDKPHAARQTHSPTTFIADLGAAYRSTHRKRPIMDMFAIHPYLIPSQVPPTLTHPRTTTIGVADYPKLVKLLTRAFARTAQPGATLPIVYDEFGYQTRIPARKRSLYNHLGTAAAKDAIAEGRQALYYRKAIAIAQCQPNVAGLLIFHVADERNGNAWQSGVYYADGKPKSSMASVRRAALGAQASAFAHCAKAKTTSSLQTVVFHDPPAEPGPLQIDIECAGTCAYRARLIDLDSGDAVGKVDDEAFGEQTIKIPADDLLPGSYQYTLRTFTKGRPGTAVVRYSRPFTIEANPPPDPPLPALQTLLPVLPFLPTFVSTAP